VLITGTIPFTSRFFASSLAEPFVLLEDEAGFVHRDKEFNFPLVGQQIGPVEQIDDNTLKYDLSLPAVPQGTSVDVDNNGQANPGVQVFAVAYWSNTWGDPFLETRDGRGWSSAYASTVTDPENDYEITGGTLVIWSPDDQQQFPTGFGDDGLLFTEDDPVAPVLPGYSLVDLDQTPFRVYKEARPELVLLEGEVATNNYSALSYTDAFEQLFAKVSVEYPFTELKNIDWEAIHAEIAPRVASARNDADFYRAMRDFAFSIPDGHVGGLFNADAFRAEGVGSFGLILKELSDGSVIVTRVFPNTAGSKAGIEPGAVITSWDGTPITQAIDAVNPNLFSSYSTDHARRQDQAVFLTRVPVGTQVAVTIQNLGDSQPRSVTMTAEQEIDSLLEAVSPSGAELNLPVEGKILPSGLGYIKISTFSDDDNLEARLWERYMEQMVENNVPGLIIDIRSNGGGSGGLALNMAGFFFDEGFIFSQEAYYSAATGQFELQDPPARLEPAPTHYDGPIALLVSANCVSACEGFAYAASQGGRATVVGNTPTAGAFGEVGRGQYKLPGDMDLQVPTGRPLDLSGNIIIEGTGIIPDVTVPLTAADALGEKDGVLDAAVQAILAKVGN
jgi:C-terminal processing protease CtpA/Prc